MCMKRIIFKIVEKAALDKERYLQYPIISMACCCHGCSGDLMYGTSC